MTSANQDIAFCRRVEEASLNAWPALQQQMLDGWVLRFSRGFTKRANSVVPLYPSALPASDCATEQIEEKIRYCENLYAKERLTTIFRLTSICPEPALDEILQDRGYQQIELNQVMALTQQEFQQTTSADPQPLFRELSMDSWLPIYSRFTNLPDTGKILHNMLLKGIAGECCFGALYDPSAPEEPVACGLAVAEHQMFGLFDIITAPDRRSAGNGTKLVQGLLQWGFNQQAHTAYLQVVSDNLPALAVYSKLGFKNLYQYWYRVSA